MERWRYGDREIKGSVDKAKARVVHFALAEGRSSSACGGTIRPKRKLRRAPVKQQPSLETSKQLLVTPRNPRRVGAGSLNRNARANQPASKEILSLFTVLRTAKTGTSAVCLPESLTIRFRH